MQSARVTGIFVAIMMFVVPTAFAQNTSADRPRESVEADVSTRSVSITSSFTGTEIIVFGTVENSRQPSAEAGTYDVVIVVEGSQIPAVVRKKSRVGGIWVNTSSVRFASFPSYYAIASTRPIDEIAEPAELARTEIGFKHVRLVPSGRAALDAIAPAISGEFRDAVVRIKQRQHLFVKSDYGVTFIGRSLFRATIGLPPNVPVGPLTARVFLYRDGQQLGTYQSKVVMERAGIERFLHAAAYENPFYYALATLLLAASAGIAAAFAFNRTTQA